MLSFGEWLDESYKFEEEDSSEGSHTYGFQDHRGHNYKVFIEKDRRTGNHDVLFCNEHPDSGHVRFKQTHDQGSHARKIFSTVHSIMKHHARNNADAKRYVFTSDKSRKGPLDLRDERPEGSRNRLYRHMTDKLGGVSSDAGYVVTHEIPADKLRH